MEPKIENFKKSNSNTGVCTFSNAVSSYFGDNGAYPTISGVLNHQNEMLEYSRASQSPKSFLIGQCWFPELAVGTIRRSWQSHASTKSLFVSLVWSSTSFMRCSRGCLWLWIVSGCVSDFSFPPLLTCDSLLGFYRTRWLFQRNEIGVRVIWDMMGLSNSSPNITARAYAESLIVHMELQGMPFRHVRERLCFLGDDNKFERLDRRLLCAELWRISLKSERYAHTSGLFANRERSFW